MSLLFTCSLFSDSVTAVNDVYTIIDVAICEGDTLVTPEGERYFETGTYIDTFFLSSSCDSIRTLNLNYFPASVDIITYESLCKGQTIEIDKIEYDSDTILYAEDVNANGCTFLQILRLSFIDGEPGTITQDTICEGEEYLWNVNNQVYNVTGTYYTLGTGPCDGDHELLLSVLPVADCMTSVADDSSKESVNIYPNPASNFLKVEARNTKAFRLRIYDLQGIVLITSKNSLSINVSSLTSGIYILEIQTESGKREVKQLVIE